MRSQAIGLASHASCRAFQWLSSRESVFGRYCFFQMICRQKIAKYLSISFYPPDRKTAKVYSMIPLGSANEFGF